MLPDNISKYLNSLFLEIGFSQKETTEKIESLNYSFEIILLDKVFKDIPKNEQTEIAGKLKNAKNVDEAVGILSKCVGGHIDQTNFKKVYTSELEKLLDQILKPFLTTCTPDQLNKLKELTQKYID